MEGEVENMADEESAAAAESGEDAPGDAICGWIC